MLIVFTVTTDIFTHVFVSFQNDSGKPDTFRTVFLAFVGKEEEMFFHTNGINLHTKCVNMILCLLRLIFMLLRWFMLVFNQ